MKLLKLKGIRELVIISFLALLSPLSVTAQDDFSIAHGPYLVDPASDAITVIWFTSKPATSWIEFSEYKESGTFPTWGGYAKIARASHDGLIDANTCRHIIRIENLKKGTKYKYRIHSKEILQMQPYEVIFGETAVGEIKTFSTLDPDPQVFTFGVVSDIHEDESVLYELDKVSKLALHDMMFLNGDILSWIGDEERIFDGFLDASVDLFAKEKPFVYIRGNHETRGAGARGIMSYFPHSSGKNYYAFTHGDVRFVVMDCGEDKADDAPVYAGIVDFDSYRTEQVEWLEKEIVSDEYKKAGYRVVLFHIPAYTDSDWHGAMDITKKWGPVLNRANVDLVINGHTHRFERIDKTEGKNNFPILITGKKMILETKVTDSQMDCSVTNTEGEIVDSFIIPKNEPTNAEDWRLGTSLGNIFKITPEVVNDLSVNGFTDVEVGFGRVSNREELKNLKEKIKEVKSWLDEKNINIWSIHIPYGKSIDISAIDETERALAIQEVTILIKAARELEPEKLVIHPSFEPIPEEERPDRLQACINSLPTLMTVASKNKMELTIEDLPRTCLGNTSKEINYILNQVPGLTVCCDVNHLLQETTEAFIDAVGSKIVTLHICDYDGLDEKHWLPGQGIINWNKVLESLELSGYNGPFMFESAGTFAEKATAWQKLISDYQMSSE